MPDEPTVMSLVVASQGRIESTLAEMRGEVNTKLDSKADKADVDGIRRDLVEHRRETDHRLDKLETDREARSERAKVHELRDNQVFSKRQKFWGTIGVILVVAATIVGPVVGALMSGH